MLNNNIPKINEKDKALDTTDAKDMNKLLYKFQDINIKDINKLFFEILYNTIDNSVTLSNKCIINNDVYYDLEIFEGVNGDNESNVFNSINKTITIFGEIYLKFVLYNPIYSIDILNKRNEITNNLINNVKYTNKIRNILKDLEYYQKDIAWIWDNDMNNEDYNTLLNMVYFKSEYLQGLNKNRIFLNITHNYTCYISPFIGIISPLISTLLPFFILKYYL